MLRPVLTLFLALATPLPALAQWQGVGRWGSEQSFRFVAPGTWMVLQQGDSVQITAEGDNHSGRIELRCTRDAPAGQLRLSRYYGDGLGLSDSEPVRFAIDGQSFERTLRYRPADRDWVASDVLDTALLNAFAWGTRLELLNAAGERITAYRLNGSGAARAALQRTCGI